MSARPALGALMETPSSKGPKSASMPALSMRVDPSDVALVAHGCEDGFASSVCKALSIFEALATSERGVLGVSDLARVIDIPKSTTHRLLKTLEFHGFIDRSGTKYRLGSRFFELSFSARWSVFGELREIALPVLEDLFERVQETVHLAVLEGEDVLYLEKITGSGGSRVPSRVGGRMPVTCTGLGKAITAFSPPKVIARTLSKPLDRVTPYSITYPRMLRDQLVKAREEGVAFDFEESRLGVACVAAPILGDDGYALGGVSVAGPTFRFKPRRVAHWVLEAANEIGRVARNLPSPLPPMTQHFHTHFDGRAGSATRS